MAQWAKTPLLWIGHQPVFQLCGAEGEGGSGDQNGNGGNNGNGAQGGDGGKGGQQSQSGQPATVTKAEFDALMARMTAADRSKSAAEARVAELEGASRSELEKAQAQLAEANKKIETLSKAQQQMLVSNAFLTVKDAPQWHSSAAALKLLDDSLITVGDDGKITGMEAAVSKLKTEHPYLVKAEAGSEGAGGKGKGNEGSGNGQNGQPSGSANNGAGGGGGKGTDRKSLEKRFPALRGR